MVLERPTTEHRAAARRSREEGSVGKSLRSEKKKPHGPGAGDCGVHADAMQKRGSAIACPRDSNTMGNSN